MGNPFTYSNYILHEEPELYVKKITEVRYRVQKVDNYKNDIAYYRD